MYQIEHIINYCGEVIDLTEELENEIEFWSNNVIIKRGELYYTKYWEIKEIWNDRISWEIDLIDEQTEEAEKERSDFSNFWSRKNIEFKIENMKKILEKETGINWNGDKIKI